MSAREILIAALLSLIGAPAVAQGGEAQAEGERVYNQNCSACHQSAGEGIPGAFPPLARSEWVNGNKGTLVNIILHGVTGAITVAGQEYYETMPGFGATLGDAQIAAVATYVRTSWGNSADAVTATEVAAARRAAEGRSEAWTVRDLLLAAAQDK